MTLVVVPAKVYAIIMFITFMNQAYFFVI